jgi:hypothetical protein
VQNAVNSGEAELQYISGYKIEDSSRRTENEAETYLIRIRVALGILKGIRSGRVVAADPNRTEAALPESSVRRVEGARRRDRRQGPGDGSKHDALADEGPDRALAKAWVLAGKPAIEPAGYLPPRPEQPALFE